MNSTHSVTRHGNFWQNNQKNMRCSDLRTETFVDLKHYAMHNKIYKQKICLNKSILHASVSSAANNLKKILTLVYLGKGTQTNLCFKSFPTTGPKFCVLGAASSGPFSLLNHWRRGSFSLKEIYTSAPSSRTPVSTTATYLSSI